MLIDLLTQDIAMIMLYCIVLVNLRNENLIMPYD